MASVLDYSYTKQSRHTRCKWTTMDGTNNSSQWSTDIALRRSRFLAVAQISPRFLILSHWGINNQSFINGGTAPNGPNPTTTPSNQGKSLLSFYMMHGQSTELYQLSYMWV
ncbi:MAG: hypothetical protein IPJ13_15080 [Saprospiraceae bacterium]|nr:hypothetical protein [Saprospiraceae bacterium]